MNNYNNFLKRMRTETAEHQRKEKAKIDERERKEKENGTRETERGKDL